MLNSGFLHYSMEKVRWKLVRGGLIRVLLFGVVWYILVDGDTASWPIGGPAIAIAVVVSVMTSGQYSSHWRFSDVPKFFLYFVWKSLVGAVDVARRAFQPRLPLEPVLREYRLRLPDGRGAVFFANIVSLLPGTLSAELKSERLVVHVLDGTGPYLHELGALEERVAHLFGQDLG